VQGFAPRRQKRTLPERVASLEVRNAELEKRLREMEAALAAAAVGAPAGSPAAEEPAAPGPAPEVVRRQSAALLRAAAEKLSLEVADPGEMRRIMQALVTLGPAGAAALRDAALDTSSADVRVPAILTMAFSRDSSHAPALRALCADRDPDIRREALTALTKVHPPSALEGARELLADPDEAVAMAADQAYRMLGGKPAGEAARAESPAPKVAPARPQGEPSKPGGSKGGKARVSGAAPRR
jgi:hypothetical protein